MRQHRSSTQSYNLKEGSLRKITLEGLIDDPYQNPLGDIDENFSDSAFSLMPVEISLVNSGYLEAIKSEIGPDGIGRLTIKRNLELETFVMNGKEHVVSPVRGWVELPGEVLNTIENTARDCTSAGKLAFLDLKFTAFEDQIVKDFEDWKDAWDLKLKFLDLDSNLAMVIHDIEFGQTIVDKVQSAKRVKTINDSAKTSTITVSVNYCYSRHPTYSDQLDQISIIGELLLEQLYGQSPKPKIKVDIELKSFWELSETFLPPAELPKEATYGNYYFSDELKYLSLELAYHPQDYRNLIKPLILQGDPTTVSFSVTLLDELSLEKEQRGEIKFYSINRLVERNGGSEEIDDLREMHGLPIKNEQADVLSRLDELQFTQERFEKALNAKLLKLEEEARFAAKDRDLMFEKITEPTDIFGKILLKIPVFGSLIRFISK